MHNKELFLLLILDSHNVQKVRANIDNKIIKLELQKDKLWNKGTNAMN